MLNYQFIFSVHTEYDHKFDYKVLKKYSIVKEIEVKKLTGRTVDKLIDQVLKEELKKLMKTKRVKKSQHPERFAVVANVKSHCCLDFPAAM